ncbi:MAG: DNA polymerase III subunit beta [Bacilli bacterium]|nr:DNA polymerase III subunit beta [Bacilli bacterium]
MKFSIKRQKLLASIQEVSNAISPRAAVIPILTGMKLNMNNDTLTLTGSNSDITIESTIKSKDGDEEVITDISNGSIVLPVPHFPDIIKKLPGEIVHIEVKDNYQTIIRSEKSVFELHGQSSEEYPRIYVEKDNPHFSIPAKDLKKLIRQTVFAVSTMETRPILTGVHVSFHDGNVRFTSTDTHRLARSEANVDLLDEQTADLSIVIPGQSLLELSKIINNVEETIYISIMKNQVVFYTDHLLFISRLLSGTYPDTDRLIPTNVKSTLRMKTKEFIRTLDRAALLASEEQNHVVRFEALGKPFIEISSNSPEIGRVNEQMEIISHEGEEVNISFSSKYLLEALRTIDSEEVNISFTGPMHPFMVTNPENEKILHLILPVRTF